MIVDVKLPRKEGPMPANGSASGTLLTPEQATVPSYYSPGPSALQADRLSIELPTLRLIYTTGSSVSGIVYLSRKDPESIQEIQISIVCSVRSRFHRYYGGNSHDVRRETTKLFHRDQTLWSRHSVDEIPPNNLSFEIRIPETGIDSKTNDNNVSLPPSFYAGRHAGWANMFTHGSRIGHIKYYVKARVTRKGLFKLNEAVAVPFIFLPPSDPPPLLPTPPESISVQELDQLKTLWTDDMVSSTIRQGIFSSHGRAVLSLWLPRVEKLPRQTSIPFFLCLLLRTLPNKFEERPPPDTYLSPLPRLDKVSVYLQQNLRVCARGGVQYHPKTYDKTPMDNFVYSITPQESNWKRISDSTSGPYWEKGYLWRGRWKFKETPNFTNRQLTLKYFLVVKVPFRGLGNDITLTSKELDISTGILAGQIPAAVEPELLPEYFELDGAASDEDDQDEEDRQEKS